MIVFVDFVFVYASLSCFTEPLSNVPPNETVQFLFEAPSMNKINTTSGVVPTVKMQFFATNSNKKDKTIKDSI